MYIYLYIHTHINAHICACTHIFYTHTHTHTYVHYTYAHKCTYMCMYTHNRRTMQTTMPCARTHPKSQKASRRHFTARIALRAPANWHRSL